jgi:hypothetical protein
MVQDIAERAERARDLKSQIAELSEAQAKEIVFMDVSPQRRSVTIYSMLTGEPIPVPRYRLDDLMKQTLPDGRYAFTADPAKAPEYRLGTVKCFLHPDSPERLTLQEIGLGGAFCPAAHLANEYEKVQHAQHKHRKQWAAYQAHLAVQERKKYEERQDRQLEATLKMAGMTKRNEPLNGAPATKDTGASVTEELPACECGWVVRGDSKNPLASLKTHKRLHCPLRSRRT